MFRALIYPSSGACDCVVELPHRSCSQFVVCWRFGVAGFVWCSFCRLHHQSSNTQRTENKTTDVVIQQHSRKLLKMDILMSEICWAHKKWNKVASDIKLVFHSSTVLKLWVPTKARILCKTGEYRLLMNSAPRGEKKVNSLQTNKQTVNTYGSSRPSVHFPKYYHRNYIWISTTYALLESLQPRWTRRRKTIPSLPEYEMISLWSLQWPLAVCVCVRACVCSSSITHLTDENAFFPTAIHVLSKCGISYFADLPGLLHTTIQFCKAIISRRAYTKLFFLAIRYSKDRTENNLTWSIIPQLNNLGTSRI